MIFIFQKQAGLETKTFFILFSFKFQTKDSNTILSITVWEPCIVASLLFLAWIHGQTTSLKRAFAALRQYHMTITDGLCQMSLAISSVSFRQQTLLRRTHCKGRDTDAISHKLTE